MGGSLLIIPAACAVPDSWFEKTDFQAYCPRLAGLNPCHSHARRKAAAGLGRYSKGRKAQCRRFGQKTEN
jgi:hypothetical protein